MKSRRDYRPFSFGPNVTRAAVRSSRHVIQPAHPRIADALVAVGAFLADRIEPALLPWRSYIRAAFWLLVIFAVGMLAGLRVAGLLS
jgi:hypothetical protein